MTKLNKSTTAVQRYVRALLLIGVTAGAFIVVGQQQQPLKKNDLVTIAPQSRSVDITDQLKLVNVKTT